jgi:2-polyprenyl-3-methyl-5-hydroxy-6-metoxy-1,4-benzoquinol methylase
VFGFAPSTSFAAGAASTARWYGEAGLIRAVGAAAHGGGRRQAAAPRSSADLAAKLEAFDSFWEAPEDVERGYGRFESFYRRNYLHRFPGNKTAPILVVSCGPGYMVRLLAREGYTSVTGIDSMEDKIRPALAKQLTCRTARAFEFLQESQDSFGAIFCEQEINHLTKEEMLDFVALCHERLRPGGVLIVHSLNGANPLVGSENLAMNLDHFSTLTEYSIRQALEYGGFGKISVFPLNLYVFYTNPLNYVGICYHAVVTAILRITFQLYGKSAKIFTKKIGARGVKAAGPGSR